MRTTDGPTLAAVVIARDEERDLPGFLASFLPWVDEVVLVDDGSSDRTREIAESAGPRVRFLPLPRAPGEGFCHQRNKGIDATRCDWLLHVDVDNRAPPELADEVRSAIRRPGFDAFRYRRLHHILHRPVRSPGAGGGWNAPWLTRRGTARFVRLVHETLEFASPSPRIGQLAHPMWHLGDASFTERLEKNIAYSRLEADGCEDPARLRSALFEGVRAAFGTYVLGRAALDGRVGLFWSLYVLSGTINRHLLAWDRDRAIPRDELDRALAARWKEWRDARSA